MMKHYGAVFLLAFFLTLSCQKSTRIPPNSLATADAVSSATHQYNPDKKITLPPPSDTYEVLGVMKGLKNFMVKYDQQLYRGGEFYSDEGAAVLKSLGIKTIVSITPTEKERELARKHQFKLVELPFNKTDGVSSSDLKHFLSLFTKENTPIYTHCHGGTHRGGTLGVAYRLHNNGWSYEKALLEHGRLGGSLKDDYVMLESIRKPAI